MTWDHVLEEIKQEAQRAKSTLKVAIAVLVFAVAVVGINWMASCTKRYLVEKRVAVQIAPPAACGDLKIGETKRTGCANGETVEMCVASGMQVISDSCGAEPPPPPPACVAFEEVRPTIDRYCVTCHAPLNDYATAEPWAAKVAARVVLADDDPRHMPPSTEEQPDDLEKAGLVAWNDAGAKDVCGSTPPPPPPPIRPTLTLDYVEASIFRHQASIDNQHQRRTRYVVATHRLNDGGGEASVEKWRLAALKALNALATTRREMASLTPIDEAKSIWAVDLEALGLNALDWKVVEKAADIKIVSETDIGRTIRALANTDSPWLHVDSLVDTTHGKAAVYYALTRTPLTLLELQKNVGVDFAGKIEAFDAVFAGGNKSEISLHKNRLLVRINGNDGFWWQSFDSLELDAAHPQRSLASFPLLKETGSKVVFDFAASEVLYQGRNGLMLSALFNAKGERQDVAPLNIVSDNRSPVTPEIRNAISCHRCHVAGPIALDDEIRDAVIRAASEFDPNDVERVKALYPVATVLARTFVTDRASFAEALGRLGVSPNDVDPVNVVYDRYHLSWDSPKLAGFLFLSRANFETLLNQSADGRAKIGGLLTNTNVTYGQIVDVFPTLVKDLRLFQDPLGG